MVASGASAPAIYPVKSPRPMVPVCFEFFPNGTSESALTVDDYGSGRVASVARTSNAGEYLVTMAHAYYKAGPISATLSMGTLPTTVALENPTTAAVTNEATQSALTFLVRVRGVTIASVTEPVVDINSMTPDAQVDVEPLPTLTDSPANVDALRDDITTNWEPVLEANFATLGDAINDLGALVTAGTLAGYDVPADATNYIKVTAWLFTASVPA